MTSLHPTAVIDPDAELGDVEVGPYAVIGAGVRLADGVRVGAHAVVEGPTVVGPRTRIGPHAVLGGDPQHRGHDGSPTWLLVGADNVFREFTTAHRGSSVGAGTTRIGDGNYFMACTHVGHDCVVGSGCHFANGASLGGHCEVGDRAFLGGLCGIHQHVRIGRLAMVGGGSMVSQDVPPFSLVQGDRARLRWMNAVGLRRAGLSDSALSALKSAWHLLFDGGIRTGEALKELRDRYPDVPEVLELADFVESSLRGVCRAESRCR